MCELKGGPCIIEQSGKLTTCHCILKENNDKAREALAEIHMDEFYEKEVLRKKASGDQSVR
jgi:hypothetical protein